ncbi:hypothetical protein CANCADRAFT_131456 [Tortispora caseinolytica NRRL Y-17796]|uniref:Phosphatidate phosphatase APP1 catalytic domain-containing protein n=1 Tax=Tortispora caseinolytica NRRL Y-17796 TaxID=767744 RepID=A0A1E4TB11_9ASCO|nr:hypothetical protein CANCADRAFT_131456 [Tortispora caseinolytica NRRL Y-17796]
MDPTHNYSQPRADRVPSDSKGEVSDYSYDRMPVTPSRPEWTSKRSSNAVAQATVSPSASVWTMGDSRMGDSRKARLLKYLRSKKEEYFAAESDPGSRSKSAPESVVSASSSDSASSMFSKDPNDEFIVLYPGYSRRHEFSNFYEIDVRGFYGVNGYAKKKERIYASILRQIVGSELKKTSGTATPKLDPATKEPLPTALPQTILEERDLISFDDPASDVPLESTDADHSEESSFDYSSFQGEELTANAVLLQRMAPLLTKPLPNKTVRVFITGSDSDDNMFNAPSATFEVKTNESGRIDERLKVGFIPATLGAETLEGRVDIIPANVLSAEGISVISDIDDTVKITGVNGSRREMLKNVFIRDPLDCRIPGVSDWYGEMRSMGASFHYVSNGPWQMFTNIYDMLNTLQLPPGSYHLRSYSGLMNGIFEPVGQRKRGSLTRILSDFPQRKFILIGDSGESDLEIYVEMCCEFPDQILAVYIRDVTTSEGSQTSLMDLANDTRLSADMLQSLDVNAGEGIPLASNSNEHMPEPKPAKGRTASDFLWTSMLSAKPLVEKLKQGITSVYGDDSDYEPKLISESVPSPPLPPRSPENGDAHLPKKTQNKVRRRQVPPVPDKPAYLKGHPAHESQSGFLPSNDSPKKPNYVSSVTPFHASAQPFNSRRESNSRPGRQINQAMRKLSTLSLSSKTAPDEVPIDILNAQRRFLTARQKIPKHIELDTWKVGSDLKDQSISLITKALDKHQYL